MAVRISFIIFFTIISGTIVHGQRQFRLQGHVYDSSRTYPLTAVSVLSTSGRGTITDSTGYYNIAVSDKDSVWFSYLNKPTVKFPVAKITDITQFDLALKVPVSVLKEVFVKPRNYKLDSIRNREDYAKVFNFKKPNVESMTSIGPMGAGVDINELIRLFQFRKNNSMLRFQQRLLQQEQDKYVDYRFNKALIRRLTKLDGDELDRFAVIFRPSYEFVLFANDYDLQAYIKKAFEMHAERKGF